MGYSPSVSRPISSGPTPIVARFSPTPSPLFPLYSRIHWKLKTHSTARLFLTLELSRVKFVSVTIFCRDLRGAMLMDNICTASLVYIILSGLYTKQICLCYALTSAWIDCYLFPSAVESCSRKIVFLGSVCKPDFPITWQLEIADIQYFLLRGDISLTSCLIWA